MKNRSLIRTILVTALVATVVNGFFIVAQHHAVAANGSDKLLWYTVPLALPFLIALLAVVISLPFLLFRSSRKEAAEVFAAGAVYLAVSIACSSIGWTVRKHGFERLASRSQPLIAAVRRFEAEHMRPPNNLAELVPRYLAAVPHTGMGAYPKYEYVAGDSAVKDYDGNPWAIWVDTPSGGLNWDIFVYYPRQNYPPRGHGGSLERVKDWAYVHE